MDVEWPHQIRRQRTALRLTQQQLADKAHVTRKTISALESPIQREPVSLSLLERVAGILGLAITLSPVFRPTLDDLLKQNAWEDSAPSDESRRRVRHRHRPPPSGGEGGAPLERVNPCAPADDIQEPAQRPPGGHLGGKGVPAGQAPDDNDGEECNRAP